MTLIYPKKEILIPVLIFALIGCASIGPNTTYYMATTSFKYDPTYVSYSQIIIKLIQWCNELFRTF